MFALFSAGAALGSTATLGTATLGTAALGAAALGTAAADAANAARYAAFSCAEARLAAKALFKLSIYYG